jgi:hypothetical protein
LYIQHRAILKLSNPGSAAWRSLILLEFNEVIDFDEKVIMLRASWIPHQCRMHADEKIISDLLSP